MNFCFTKPGRAWNEDRCYSCENFIFLLDGATAISNQKFSDFATDAEWYSNWWYNYLKVELENYNLPLYEILQAGVRKVKEDYSRLAGGNVVFDFPSSTVAIARKLENNVIEIYILGDSPMFIQSKTGKTIKLADSLVNTFDDVNIAIIDYYARRDNISFFEARKIYGEGITQGRLGKNHQWGYNILADDETAILRGIYRKIDGNIFNKIIIASDGYAQITELFNLYSLDEFANKLESVSSASELYDELYKSQEADKDIKKFLRTKLRDDSSVCVLTID